MPRPVFAFILTVLIVVATFSGLAFVCAAPHTTKSSQHPEGDWRILIRLSTKTLPFFRWSAAPRKTPAAFSR